MANALKHQYTEEQIIPDTKKEKNRKPKRCSALRSIFFYGAGGIRNECEFCEAKLGSERSERTKFPADFPLPLID